ncbi:hypothetical protein Ancab_028353 [Ancistrocladus abbreviatus]
MMMALNPAIIKAFENWMEIQKKKWAHNALICLGRNMPIPPWVDPRVELLRCSLIISILQAGIIQASPQCYHQHGRTEHERLYSPTNCSRWTVIKGIPYNDKMLRKALSVANGESTALFRASEMGRLNRSSRPLNERKRSSSLHVVSFSTISHPLCNLASKVEVDLATNSVAKDPWTLMTLPRISFTTNSPYPFGNTGPTTSPYQDPESMKNLKPNPKWDAYSFGIVLLELLTRKVYLDRELAQLTPGAGLEDRY